MWQAMRGFGEEPLHDRRVPSLNIQPDSPGRYGGDGGEGGDGGGGEGRGRRRRRRRLRRRRRGWLRWRRRCWRRQLCRKDQEERRQHSTRHGADGTRGSAGARGSIASGRKHADRARGARPESFRVGIFRREGETHVHCSAHPPTHPPCLRVVRVHVWRLFWARTLTHRPL